jgi:phage antirepressor YoqD-like protein
MERQEKQMAEIEAILMKRIVRKNAITAREIAKTVGIKDNDTFVNTRMLIRTLMKNKHLPIGALDNKGYFLIENQEELNSYVKTLERRARGLSTRQARAIVFFETYYKEDFEETDEFEEDEDMI